jgi:hypothetical protein
MRFLGRTRLQTCGLLAGYFPSGFTFLRFDRSERARRITPSQVLDALFVFGDAVKLLAQFQMIAVIDYRRQHGVSAVLQLADYIRHRISGCYANPAEKRSRELVERHRLGLLD